MKRWLSLLFIGMGAILFSCVSEEAKMQTQLEECVLTSYQMSDIYFASTDTLVAQIRIIEVSRNKKGYTSKESIQEGIALANRIYSKALIKLEVKEHIVIHDAKAADRMDEFIYMGVSHNKPNFINVYIYPPDSYSGYRSPKGRASSAPGTFLSIKSQYVGTSTLAHEFGHLIGLYHIFEEDEDPTGYNSTSGDLVCDTYRLDKMDNAYVNQDCQYKGAKNYPKRIEKDLVHNIMSYSNPKCRIWISDGQAKRARAKIADSQRVLNTMLVQR